ncbi:Sorting nexin-18 [Sciurus carolinensis]|uniref:Sorting nexin-18 n=1 Tax=Sciurus carolinensis TaxID=30640 RepID=A0AA41STD5_SCICA|nr:Sorting nexin-18 [Sciurus carolinensis]
MGNSCPGVRVTLLRSLALYHLRSENSGRYCCWSRRYRACAASRISRAGSRGQQPLPWPLPGLLLARDPSTQARPAGDGIPGTPAYYANVPPGGFQSLPTAQPTYLKLLSKALMLILQLGILQPSPQQFCSGYQASQGSKHDWDDEWEDSSMVAYEPGTLGIETYSNQGSSSVVCSVADHYCLSMCWDLLLNQRSGREAFMMNMDKVCMVGEVAGKALPPPVYHAYKLVPMHTQMLVHQHYKHFGCMLA